VGKAAETRRAQVADRAAQPELRAELTEAGLDPALLGRAVVTWNRQFPGQHYTGAHRFARTLLNARIQGAPMSHDPAWLAPMADEPVWTARTWTVPVGAPDLPEVERADLAAYDVNGAWLSAATCELPAGPPDILTDPGQPGDVPGYVRVTNLDGEVPHGIGSRWEPGMWMPTPIVQYLRDQTLVVEVDRAILWLNHKRWLDPHVEMIRGVRSALLGIMAATEEGEALAAAAVLGVVRGIYQRMCGGLLASQTYNPGATYQPVWADMIPAVAQSRMLRNIDKVRGGAVQLVGVHVDAAWFALPRAWADPPGLPISAQLGKFKTAGRIPWTAEISEAWVDQDSETIRKALADA